MTMSDDPVVQDLGRYMNGEDKAQAEHNKELEQVEDMVNDIQNSILSLKEIDNSNFSEVTLSDCHICITIDLSEVEDEAFRDSLNRRSTDTYVVEKTAIEVS